MLETRVTKVPGSFLHILDDVDADHYANSINYSLTMTPSKKAVLSMAKMFRYNPFIINPKKKHKDAMKNYWLGRRLAFVFSKKSDLTKFPADELKMTFIYEISELLVILINFVLAKLRLKRYF